MARSLVLVLLLAAPALLCGGRTRAESLPVLLDGLYDEWTATSLVHEDPSGDGGGSGIDLGRLHVADDPLRLFLRFETGAEIQLDEGNSLVLYLDTDANSQTGLAIGGIGAELEWRLGERSGTFRAGGQTTPVGQGEIGFIGSPTVSAREFEVGLDRGARPDGVNLLLPGPTIRILIWDRPSGDRLPDQGGIVQHTMDENALPPEEAIPLGRELAGDLRVATYNIHNDSPWDALLGPKMRRQMQALDPEVIAFQEIYDHTPQQTRALVESWLPSGAGEAWHAASRQDCHTVSRFPIEQTWSLDGNLAALLDARERIGSKLLVVNVHLPCCTDDAGRQREVDRILSFLRDAKEPGGNVTLDPRTPYLILGDTNFVGLARQLDGLLAGDIEDEGTFGPDFEPDWDGGGLEDLASRHTERRVTYTWRNDASSFWPGRLDFMIFTGSVLRTGNHLVLFTPEMADDSLDAHGLQRDDSWASDHLIHCADFRPADTGQVQWVVEPGRLAIWPNPSRQARGRLALGEMPAGEVRLELIDPVGRRFDDPLALWPIEHPGGEIVVSFDLDRAAGGRPASGVYLLRLRHLARNGETTYAGRWLLIR